jgi:phosphoribosyl 1,2-cyclic phosphodiesterase
MARKKPILRFWGVRGSIATPGSSTVRYGGNTACVELSLGDDRLIFDAGSGLRELGITLVKEPNLDLTIALSHYHWDHLLGLPFFVPLFKPDTTLHLYGEAKGEGGGPREAMERQFSSPSFPVPFSTLPSTLDFHPLQESDTFNVGEIAVRTGRLNHPNGAICYRAQVGNRSVVYASDHEHDGDGDAQLIAFCGKADVLVYDAMYSNESYAQGKKGWGHSTWEEGVRVAKAAKVKNLFLFHHDPMNDDKKLAAIERAAQKAFPNAVVAREGLAFEF